MEQIVAINSIVVELDGVKYVPLDFHRERMRSYKEEIAGLNILVNEKIEQLQGRDELLISQNRSLFDLGQRLAEAQHEQTERSWHKTLDKVDMKRCPEGQKKILACLRDMEAIKPVTPDGFFQASWTEIMQHTQLSKSTAKRHAHEMEEKAYVERKEEGGVLYWKVDPQIKRTPWTIEKITPVVRKAPTTPVTQTAKPKRANEIICPNCGGIHLLAQVRITGTCYDCLRPLDETQEVDTRNPEDRPAEVTPAAVVRPRLDNPERPCPECQRPRVACWYWFEDGEGPGFWDYSCLLGTSSKRDERKRA